MLPWVRALTGSFWFASRDNLLVNSLTSSLTRALTGSFWFASRDNLLVNSLTSSLTRALTGSFWFASRDNLLVNSLTSSLTRALTGSFWFASRDNLLVNSLTSSLTRALTGSFWFASRDNLLVNSLTSSLTRAICVHQLSNALDPMCCWYSLTYFSRLPNGMSCVTSIIWEVMHTAKIRTQHTCSTEDMTRASSKSSADWSFELVPSWRTLIATGILTCSPCGTQRPCRMTGDQFIDMGYREGLDRTCSPVWPRETRDQVIEVGYGEGFN